jgi:hypothetical protein
MKLVASALLMLALSGCASMDKSECLTVDWRTIGYEDGVAGRSGDRIAQHRKACAKHGVTPDLNAYQAGRDMGLREYCQPDNGYNLGVRGAGYNASCPVDLKGGFETAYNEGFELYSMRARVNNANNAIEAAHSELEQIGHDLVDITALILAKDTDNTVRAQALLDAKNLAERQGRLKAQIPQLERDRAAYQRDLDSYAASTRVAR